MVLLERRTLLLSFLTYLSVCTCLSMESSFAALSLCFFKSIAVMEITGRGGAAGSCFKILTTLLGRSGDGYARFCCDL